MSEEIRTFTLSRRERRIVRRWIFINGLQHPPAGINPGRFYQLMDGSTDYLSSNELRILITLTDWELVAELRDAGKLCRSTGVTEIKHHVRQLPGRRVA